MGEYSIAIMFVAALAFIAFMAWLYLQYKGVDNAIKAEILKLRQDVNSLNAISAMKVRGGPPQYMPTVGGL